MIRNLTFLISTCAFAANPAIGIVTASGHFTLDRSQVWGNATIFEGSIVETTDASSEVALRNGVKLQLAKDSRARFLADRVVMEKGIGQVSGTIEIDAANLRIHSTGKSRVSLGDGVLIASLLGSTEVSSTSGLRLAAIPAGKAMAFSPQAANGTVTRTGCLLYKDNHFIMQDENTQEVVELSGQNLAAQVGNRIEMTGVAATGKPAVSIATLLVNVSNVAPKSSGGCLSVASTLNAQTEVNAAAAAPAQTAASKSGMSTGAKIAIIGAIAGGGAGAAIALASKKSSTSP